MDNKSNSEPPETEKAVAGIERVERKSGPKKTGKTGGIIVAVTILITAVKIGMFDKVSFNIGITSLIGPLAALIVGTTFLWNRYGGVAGCIGLVAAVAYMIKYL